MHNLPNFKFLPGEVGYRKKRKEDHSEAHVAYIDDIVYSLHDNKWYYNYSVRGWFGYDSCQSTKSRFERTYSKNEK